MLAATDWSGGPSEALLYSNGYKFTTYDQDNDGYVGVNCAVFCGGGFWYDACAYADINGMNGPQYWMQYIWNVPLQSHKFWIKCVA